MYKCLQTSYKYFKNYMQTIVKLKWNLANQYVELVVHIFFKESIPFSKFLRTDAKNVPTLLARSFTTYCLIRFYTVAMLITFDNGRFGETGLTHFTYCLFFKIVKNDIAQSKNISMSLRQDKLIGLTWSLIQIYAFVWFEIV